MRFFLNFIFSLLPPTRAFLLKRVILKRFNVFVGNGTRVCGGLKIYGRGTITIGERGWLGLNSKFYLSPDTNVVIGDNCDIAPDVIFHTGTHLLGGKERRAGQGKGDSICIKNGVWIGMGTKILAGCTVGQSSIVAAGTVLLGKNYPDNALIAGVPGKVIKILD